MRDIPIDPHHTRPMAGDSPEDGGRQLHSGIRDGDIDQVVLPSGEIPLVIQEARKRPPTPRVNYTPRRYLVIIPLIIAVAGSIALHARLVAAGHLPPMTAILWFAGLFIITMQICLSWFQPVYKDGPGPLNVLIVIPTFNEDLGYLARVLESLMRQTRKPQTIVVYNDGSDKVDYKGFPEAYPEVTWIDAPVNKGKKHGHLAGFFTDPNADVYVTIDSDSAMADGCLEEILKPFADPRVMGVAGFEWAYNIKQNTLTRTIGARSVGFQLFAMSSQSAARGNVLIAPGALSAFRGTVIRECAHAYLNETFCGMPVVLGDDTMLTLMALMRGRVVQQPTAMCFPAYPEKISHHIRQWIRWMRASTIRQIWRLRFLPMSTYGWWFSVWQLGAFTAGISATALLILAWPASLPLLIGTLAGLLVWPLILSIRLFCVKRSDQGFWSRLAGVSLMPLGALWYLLVLRWLRFWGIWTLAHQGWVTRKNVEVELHDEGKARGF